MTITREVQAGFETQSMYSEGASSIVGLFTISSTKARTGTYSVREQATTLGLCWILSASRQKRVGIHLNYDDVGSNGNAWLRLLDASSNWLVHLRQKPSGLVELGVGGAVVATWSGVGNNNWYHIGVDVKIDSSAGWVKVYIDGIERLSYTGNTGNANIQYFYLGNSSSASAQAWSNYGYYDDLLIDDTAGESAAAVVPDRRFLLLLPTGNGNYSQWAGSDGNSTDNYALVDENPNNGETDYVFADSADQLDSYPVGDISSTLRTIYAVIPFAKARKTDGSIGTQIALGTRLSSTDVIGSDKNLPTTFSYNAWERQTTKPGGGSWTVTDVNNAEIIIKSRGSYS